MSILQKDASISNVQLADMVGLAPSSCLRRVSLLKERGVIRRIVALADPEKIGRGIRAVVTFKLKDHSKASLDDTVQRFGASEAVSQVYIVSGEFDLIAVISGATMPGFHSEIQNILAGTDNVEKYFCHFIMDEHKFEPAL